MRVICVRKLRRVVIICWVMVYGLLGDQLSDGQFGEGRAKGMRKFEE